MGIQQWSDDILMGELAEEPVFSEDLTAVSDTLGQRPQDVVLNFKAIDFLNSSNIARLLKLRKLVLASGRRLVLCGINNQVWGVFLVTGLDKIFEFTGDVSTALATLQLTGEDAGN